jgi:hypothetical protein
VLALMMIGGFLLVPTLMAWSVWFGVKLGARWSIVWPLANVAVYAFLLYYQTKNGMPWPAHATRVRGVYQALSAIALISPPVTFAVLGLLLAVRRARRDVFEQTVLRLRWFSTLAIFCIVAPIWLATR